MFDLKPLNPDAIPKALQKAERYRLLNEPEEAESICLDILAIEPDNQQALVMLLLAQTDQFHQDQPRRGEAGAVVLVAAAGQAGGHEPVDALPDRQPG